MESDPTAPAPARRRSRSAFSLAEVTIAIGIVAVGIIALLGLLPHGLQTMKEAADLSSETRIAQQIVADVMLLDWGDETDDLAYLRAFANRNEPFLFDELAIRVDRPADATYVARVEIPAIENGDVVLPGGNAPEPNLRRVVIKIVSVPDPSFDFDAPANQGRFRTYSTVVARMKN